MLSAVLHPTHPNERFPTLPSGATAPQASVGETSLASGPAGETNGANSAEVTAVACDIPAFLPAKVWRCLDKSHPPDCVSCSCPPLPAAYCATKLCCPITGESTEKRLRTALAFCKEWTERDPVNRERLALAAEAGTVQGGARFAALLRSKDSSAVRKEHLFTMCSEWGYCTAFWTSKRPRPPNSADDIPARRPAPTRPAPPPASSLAPAAVCDDEATTVVDTLFLLPVLALRDRTLTVLSMATLCMSSTLRPMLESSTAGWSGQLSRAAFVAAGGAGVRWARVRNIEGSCAVTRWLAECLRARQASCRSFRERLDSSEQASQPAYWVDTQHLCPEAELDAIRVVLRVGEPLTQCHCDKTRRPDGTLPSAEAAWLCDYRAAHAGSLAILAVVQSSVEQRRLGPLRTFLQAVEAALEALLAYSELTEAALQRKKDWLGALAERAGDSAGCRQLAWAQPASLEAALVLGPRTPGGPLVTPRNPADDNVVDELDSINQR